MRVSVHKKVSVTLQDIDETLSILQVQGAIHSAYCGETWSGVCNVAHVVSPQRRRLVSKGDGRDEMFNVTRVLTDDDSLAAPQVDTTALRNFLGPGSSMVTSLGHAVSLEAQLITSQIEAPSRLVDTAYDLPELLSIELGIDPSAIYFISFPVSLMPPAAPPAALPSFPSSPKTPQPAEVGEQAAQQTDGAWGVPLRHILFVCLPLAVGTFATLAVTAAALLTTSNVTLSMMRYLTIFSSTTSFCYSVAFTTSAWYQHNQAVGTSAEMEMLLIACLSIVFIALSVLVSVLLVGSVMFFSWPSLINMTEFKDHQVMNGLILMMTVVSFEAIQMLPWRNLEEARITSSFVRTRFIMPPLVIGFPQALLLAFYLYTLLTHDSMAEHRGVHAALASFTLGFVMLSLVCCGLARICTTPSGAGAHSARRTNGSSGAARTQPTLSAGNMYGTAIGNDMAMPKDFDTVSRTLGTAPVYTSTQSASPESLGSRTKQQAALNRARSSNSKVRSGGIAVTRKNSWGAKAASVVRVNSFGRPAIRKVPHPKAPDTAVMQDTVRWHDYVDHFSPAVTAHLDQSLRLPSTDNAKAHLDMTSALPTDTFPPPDAAIVHNPFVPPENPSMAAGNLSTASEDPSENPFLTFAQSGGTPVADGEEGQMKLPRKDFI